MSLIRAITVVIPARNEEELIDHCLVSIAGAVSTLRESLGLLAPAVTIIVVADACTDETANIAGEHTGVRVERTEFARVGAARRHGVNVGLREQSVAPIRHWIANTDADSVVPPNWLLHQAQLANSGHDVMIGTVRPSMRGLSATQQQAWHRTHITGQPNGHVHGANLGVRASSYLAAGGFLDQPEHEDNDLVGRLLAAGASSIASDTASVETSSRRFGRTPGGYAGYLRELDSRELDALSAPS